MTAPARPDALGVECPYCWACKGEACYVYRRPGGRDQNQRSPHGARIRAVRIKRAAEAEKEKNHE